MLDSPVHPLPGLPRVDRRDRRHPARPRPRRRRCTTAAIARGRPRGAAPAGDDGARDEGPRRAADRVPPHEPAHGDRARRVRRGRGDRHARGPARGDRRRDRGRVRPARRDGRAGRRRHDPDRRHLLDRRLQRAVRRRAARRGLPHGRRLRLRRSSAAPPSPATRSPTTGSSSTSTRSRGSGSTGSPSPSTAGRSRRTRSTTTTAERRRAPSPARVERRPAVRWAPDQAPARRPARAPTRPPNSARPSRRLRRRDGPERDRFARLLRVEQRRDRPCLGDRVSPPEQRLGAAADRVAEILELRAGRSRPVRARSARRPPSPRSSITGRRQCQGSSRNSEPSLPTTSSSSRSTSAVPASKSAEHVRRGTQASR